MELCRGHGNSAKPHCFLCFLTSCSFSNILYLNGLRLSLPDCYRIFTFGSRNCKTRPLPFRAGWFGSSSVRGRILLQKERGNEKNRSTHTVAVPHLRNRFR